MHSKLDAGVFRASVWIGTGKKYASSPGYVRDALAEVLAIPSTLEKLLFPTPSTSVLGALSTAAAIIPHHSTAGTAGADDYPLSEFFTTSTLVSLFPLQWFKSAPIPSEEVVEGLLRIVGQQWLNGRVTLRYRHLKDDSVDACESADLPLMPLYTLKVWQMVHRLCSVLADWSAAVQWLSSLQALGSVVSETRLLLSRIPWSGKLAQLDGGPDTPVGVPVTEMAGI